MKRLWAHPPLVRANAYLLAEPRERAGWRDLAGAVDVLGLQTDAIAEVRPDFLADVAGSGARVAVEGGGLLSYTLLREFVRYGRNVGERSARVELEKMSRGALDVQVLTLDDPCYRVLFRASADPTNPGWFLDQATAELYEYLWVIRSERPGLRIGLTMGAMNWGWGGIPAYWGVDRTPVAGGQQMLRGVAEAFEAAGFAIDHLHLDAPYDYVTKKQDPGTGWDGYRNVNWWERLRRIGSWAERRGVRWGVIVNSQRRGQSGDTYWRDTGEYARMLAKRWPGMADVVVQSWFPKPDTMTGFRADVDAAAAYFRP